MGWIFGRQKSGYLKKCIFQSETLRADCYILKYPTGSEIKPHTDPVQRGRHYRLNIILKNGQGGKFICDGKFFKFGPIIFFRPDLYEHSVTPITAGTRYVLSIGFVLCK